MIVPGPAEDASFLVGVVDGAKNALDDTIMHLNRSTLEARHIIELIQEQIASKPLNARDQVLEGWAAEIPSSEADNHADYLKGELHGADTICKAILTLLEAANENVFAVLLTAYYEREQIGSFGAWEETPSPVATPLAASTQEKLDPEGFVKRSEIPRLVAEYLIASLPVLSDTLKSKSLLLTDIIQLFMEAAQQSPLIQAQKTALWNSQAVRHLPPISQYREPMGARAADDYDDWPASYGRGAAPSAPPAKAKLKRGFQSPTD